MNRKLKILAASVFIVLSFSLGITGILKIFPNVFANNNNNYSYLGLALNFQQRPKSANPQIFSTLDLSNQDIQNLTPEQIEAMKLDIENFVNNEFMDWQTQKIQSGELQPFASTPDNESVHALFLQFLSERPDCAECFAQYDQLLSEENQLQMRASQGTIVRETDLVIQQGEIISEQNENQIINGTQYYIVTRQYSLTINGTTQNVTKITVTTENGTVFMDPAFRIDIWPLLWSCYVWVFWPGVYIGPWPTVVLYGWDYYMFTKWSPGPDAALHLFQVNLTLQEGYFDLEKFVGDTISFASSLIGIAAYIAGTGLLVVAGAVVAVAGIAYLAYQIAEWAVAKYQVDRYLDVIEYNNVRNQTIFNWGWMECDYLHYPTVPPVFANPPCFDSLMKLRHYIVSCDGGFVEKLPVNDLSIFYPGVLSSYLELIVLFGLLYGFGNWVEFAISPLDITPPTTSGSSSGTLGANGWYTSDAVVTLSAVDNVGVNQTYASGVNMIEYSLNDATSWNNYTEQFTITNEGITVVYYRSIDYENNIESPKYMIIMIDKTPPVTAFSLSGTPGLNGWYTSDVTVNLSAADNVSGVNMTEYSFDGIIWNSYTEPFTITNEGVTTLYYRSTDIAGNVENTKTEIIMVDKTPPVTDLAIGTPIYIDGAGNVYVTSATGFILTTTDSVSGVAHTYYRINGGDWMEYTGVFNISGPIKTYTIDYYSVDVAGNNESMRSKTVILEEEFHGWAVLRINGKLFMGDANLFRSEHLIRVEVGGQIATWNITKQIVIPCDEGILEVYWGKGALGSIFLMIHRGETSSHVLAAGRGVFFTSCTCFNREPCSEKITLKLC